MKRLFVYGLLLCKMVAVSLSVAEAATPTNLGPEPGCFPGDPCDS